eukprot:scaffold34424_cov75-Phaeocystis_antarctica.AAC.7
MVMCVFSAATPAGISVYRVASPGDGASLATDNRSSSNVLFCSRGSGASAASGLAKKAHMHSRMRFTFPPDAQPTALA